MSPAEPASVERASEPNAEPALAGWFGKIPALGDFVTRRLPANFVEHWDAWLSTELVDAQLALASAWQDTYRQAPIWRFALMPGAIDHHRWYGAWIPSFDRVGRQFPLTIALAGQSSVDAAQRCWAVFVATGRRALDPTCGANCIDAALREGEGEQTALAGRAASFDQRVAAVLSGAGEGSSLWWPWFVDDPAGAAITTFDGLPRGEDFLTLLLARQG
ncbi:putative Phosphoprotein phosphatase [Burkholderiales bacterium]|nr:putative Phosphoprotein phosphatase [Burkholderiales bacterium]